jgi:antitoxin (DNA-binding transcriptional repressor) of toxin-antitoxin stability system
MKEVNLETITLENCVNDAQEEQILINRDGKPVALIIGLEDMDSEQLELSKNSNFWKLIAQRRQEKTISRAELERRLGVEP